MKRRLHRPSNASIRPREYLAATEIESMIEAAASVGNYRLRDATMILLAYRHGFRASEICGLTWSQIDLGQGLISVNRVKNGVSSVQPLGKQEVDLLVKLKRTAPPHDPHVFTGERGRLHNAGFGRIVRRAGSLAGLPWPVHPHMLRHACGYKLANDGQDTRAIQQYLGHRNIQHTVRYTDLSPERFRDFWKE